jgi:hypothetical protein
MLRHLMQVCALPSYPKFTEISCLGDWRSDHFSLARVAIPAFSVDQGELFESHNEAWGPRPGRGLRNKPLPPAPPTNIVPTGIFAATPSWRDSALF